MCIIRKDLNLCTRQTLALSYSLRNRTTVSKKREVIGPSFKKKLFEKSRELDTHFCLDSVSFLRHVEVPGKKIGQKTIKKCNIIAENYDEHVVVVEDLAEFINEIIMRRNIPNKNTLVRVGLDGGGGF